MTHIAESTEESLYSTNFSYRDESVCDTDPQESSSIKEPTMLTCGHFAQRVTCRKLCSIVRCESCGLVCGSCGRQWERKDLTDF